MDHAPLAVGGLVGGRFRVERKLGQGGMGEVYLAVQEPLGRKVALKVMRERSDAEALARFHNEAKAVAHLNCPHVVALYDFGEHEGAPYIAMELLDGETLRQRMKSRAQEPVDDVLSWMRDVACGLRMAHENGIVHRDLKPENVMLVPDRDRGFIAKLLDFGIAKRAPAHRGGAGSGAGNVDDNITGDGVVFGTPGYMAPEVAVSGVDDPRGDVYALGVVFYEALVHAPPYSAPTSLALMMAHVNEPVPDPRAKRPDIPDDVAALVKRMMAKDARARPANGAELVVALDELRAARTEGFTPASMRSMSSMTSLQSTPSSPLSSSSGPTPVDRPSIALQPFVAIGAASDEDAQFAEGISEDILTALSCFKQLFVVAQSTMWAQGGRETDALRVGKTLGVRYVVGGTVRRAASRVRVNANLVDVNTGAQLWSQRFESALDDIFAVQDTVTQSIVACVAGHIEKDQAETAKRKPPHALAAYDWLARGRALHHRRTLDDNARAREAMNKAVELDPEYAQAHAWRACVFGQAVGMTGDEQWVHEVRRSTARALALDDSDSECHRLAAELAMRDGDLDKAEHHHARARSLNPNDARIVGQRGELSLYQGRLAEAAEALSHAVRLDLLHPAPYVRHLAAVRYLDGDLDEAWRLVRTLSTDRADVLALGAAVAALRGDAASVHDLVTKLHALAPAWTTRDWQRPFARADLVERWRSGFERAGLTPR